MVMTLSLRNACDRKKANRKRKIDKNRARVKRNVVEKEKEQAGQGSTCASAHPGPMGRPPSLLI